MTTTAASSTSDMNPIGLSAAGAAFHLPAGLTARSFGPAWLLAVVAHVGLLLLVLTAPVAPPGPPEELVRLVFVEPPPPPPAPLGVANGGGTVPAPVQVEKKPEPVVVQPKPKVKPVVPDSARLRHVDAQAKRRPEPKPEPPEPVQEARAPVAPAEVAPGVATGSVGGEAGGVVGGVAGGIAGGVVGGKGTGPVPVGQVANPPRVIHRVAPTYPDTARRRGVNGLVLLEAVVDLSGHVEPDVKVLQSIPMLDKEAILAVRQWRFTPARNRDGDAIRVILEIPIRFTLRS